MSLSPAFVDRVISQPRQIVTPFDAEAQLRQILAAPNFELWNRTSLAHIFDFFNNGTDLVKDLAEEVFQHFWLWCRTTAPPDARNYFESYIRELLEHCDPARAESLEKILFRPLTK